jgi:hypothetical protein
VEERLVIDRIGCVYCEEAELAFWLPVEEEDPAAPSELGGVRRFPTLAKLPGVCNGCVPETGY